MRRSTGSWEPPHPGYAYVYLALSGRLTGWAEARGGGLPFKIGTTDDLAFRERTLSDGFPRKDGSPGPPLAGCRDWQIVDSWTFRSRSLANAVEGSFKKQQKFGALASSFERIDLGQLPWAAAPGNGAGDLYIVPPNVDGAPRPVGGLRRGALPFPLRPVVQRLTDRVRAEIARLYPAHEPVEEWPDRDDATDRSERDEHIAAVEDEMWRYREEHGRDGEQGWPYDDEDGRLRRDPDA